MKTRTLLIGLTLASFALPGACLLAQSASNSDSLVLRQMNLDLVDKQAREAAEREVARARTLRLAPATYDLNHDGQLDAVEFANWEKQVREVAQETPSVLHQFDKNHDRKLDDAEWAVAREVVMRR